LATGGTPIPEEGHRGEQGKEHRGSDQRENKET
jgi:hypothetical protein